MRWRAKGCRLSIRPRYAQTQRCQGELVSLMHQQNATSAGYEALLQYQRFVLHFYTSCRDLLSSAYDAAESVGLPAERAKGSPANKWWACRRYCSGNLRIRLSRQVIVLCDNIPERWSGSGEIHGKVDLKCVDTYYLRHALGTEPGIVSP